MAVKTSHLIGVGLIAGGIYYLTTRQQPPPPLPPPPEPPELPTGYTVEEIEEWVYEQFPNARRLSPEEAGILEIDAGWVQLTYAGGKPKHVAVAFLEQGELAYHILVIEPDVGDLGKGIASLVGFAGFGIVELPEGAPYYTPVITPPKTWLKWIAGDKLFFIASVEAIVQITPPAPDPLEAEIRRAGYYNLVENTKAPAILFEHAGFKGVWMPVWGDLSELPDALDGEVSSVMIAPSPFEVPYPEWAWQLTLFDDLGNSISLLSSCGNLHELNWGDRARSVQLIRTTPSPTVALDSKSFSFVGVG